MSDTPTEFPTDPLAWIDGTLRPLSEATLPITDAGIQHGVGLFETFFLRNDRILDLQAHLQRLCNSARSLGIAAQMDPNSLTQAVKQVVRENGLKHARLRITLTGGSLSLLKPEQPEITPSLFIQPQPPIAFDPAFHTQGVRVLIHGPLLNPMDHLAGHKTLNYWPRLSALRRAGATGAQESILLNITNHLGSGCVSNLFVVRHGTLFTPIARGEEAQGALGAPVLPGITRARTLSLAESLGIPTEKRMLTVDDLLDADEVFLTNSNWMILPVNHVEQKQIGNGNVGEMTHQLLRDMLNQMEQCEPLLTD